MPYNALFCTNTTCLFLHCQDGYVANVADVIKVGEVVKVRVLSVDPDAKRLALTRKGLGPKSAAAAAAADDYDEEGAPGCVSPSQQCCCSMVRFGCLV